MKVFKHTLLTVLLVFSLPLVAAQQVTAAGSSFIYPVLAKWAQTYNKTTQIQINYQPIGSGGGIRAIEARTVAFAASDKPLTTTELRKQGLVQAPMIVGGIVPVVNIPGIKNNQLILNGSVLAGIYMGKITKWNDAAIKKLNPSLTLPNKSIISVHRSDGSGTTFNFTNYLAKVSPLWKKNVGANTVVSWPGFGLGAKGNAGVASQVRNLPGSIGYVEFAYAIQNNMVTARMKNRSGHVIKPSGVTFAAAAENAKWNANKGFYLILTNQPGVMSWPIVATTFVLIPQKPRSKAERKAAVKFLTWSYKNGKSMAQDLDYVAIPPTVFKKVLADWSKRFM